MAPRRRVNSPYPRAHSRLYCALNFFATIFGTTSAGITQVLQKRGATHATFGFMSILGHDKTFSQPINWTTSFFMFAFHVGAIAALFFFTWTALALAVVLYWIAGSLGIGIGYHRLLTHRGYKTHHWIEYFLTVCGTLALEGGPIAWVATHRVHHQNTDKEGDPHSPQDGGIWAHMGWIITGQAMHQNTAELLPYVPDLRKQTTSTCGSASTTGCPHNARRRDARGGWLELHIVGRIPSHRSRTALHMAG